MKIFVICSKRFYNKVSAVKKELEEKGHDITLPNCFNDPGTEDRYRSLGVTEHSKWKGEMLKHSADVIENNDAVLVLNFEKDGIKNYIGGATFLEMYDAFRLNKKIFIYNEVPEGMLRDEIWGFNPVCINEDLNKIY